jgi:predicted aspartyl protease
MEKLCYSDFRSAPAHDSMRLFPHTFVLFLPLLASLSATSHESIPIKVAGGAVLVPVRINDRSLNFLLDTGSGSSAIDPSTAVELKLTPHGTKRIQKNFRDLVVDVTAVGPVRILNTDFPRVELAEVNLAPVSKALGMEVDGVLGIDVLQDVNFKLNYSQHTLIIGPLTKLGTLGAPVTLRRSNGQFLVSTDLLSVATELVLDTGTNSTNLSSGTWNRLSKKWTPRQIVEGIQRAGNPTSPAILVCLPSIRLGGVILTNQAVRAQTRSDAGAFASDDFGGILGSDILRQFEITFDLKKDTVYLLPDVHYTVDPYRYTTIGIQIARDVQGAVQIMSVWKNSPAAKAGIQAGDLIEAINGQPIESQTLEQVSSKLHSREGTEIRLEIERHTTFSTIKVRTQTLLCER